MSDTAVAEPQLSNLQFPGDAEGSDLSQLSKSDLQNTIGQAFDEIAGVQETKEEKPVKEEVVEKAVEETPEPEKEEVVQEDHELSTEEEQHEEKAAEKAMTPKAFRQWKQLRAEAKERLVYKKEVDQLRQQLSEASRTAPEVESLKQQLQELQERDQARESEAYLYKVEMTDRYKKAVTEPFEQRMTYLDTIATRQNYDPAVLKDLILRGDENKLAMEIGDWPEPTRVKVWQIANDIQILEERKADIQANAKQAFETAQRDQQSQMEKLQSQILEERQKAVNELAPKLQEFVKTLPEKHQFDVAAFTDQALKFDEMAEGHKAFSVFAAATLPKLRDAYNAQATELKEAKAELAKLRNGTPKAAGGTPTKTIKAEDDVPKDAGDWAEGILKKAGIRS